MKKWLGIMCMLLLAFCLAGCTGNGENEDEQSNVLQVYYINRDETSIRALDYEVQETESIKAVEELLEVLRNAPEEKELKATLFAEVEVRSYMMIDSKLLIDFSNSYKQMSPTTEVLVRAAIVRTLTQIDGIQTVEFKIEGENFLDYAGIVVGAMNTEQFIDNTGTEINAYEVATLQLYFANKEGTELVPVSQTVEYNTNISLEKLVIEQLIKGPAGIDSYPTINPATKLINVTVTDGTCYVNLDQTFLTQVYTVSSEVTIYSIVNSLVELDNVNKVQILINGDSNVRYRESLSLNTTFGRNLDLIQEEEPISVSE